METCWTCLRNNSHCLWFGIKQELCEVLHKRYEGINESSQVITAIKRNMSEVKDRIINIESLCLLTNLFIVIEVIRCGCCIYQGWSKTSQTRQAVGAQPSNPGMTPEDNTNAICIICMHEEKRYMAEPCNHVCVCEECVQPLKQQYASCPICGGSITRYARIYLS